MFYMIERNNSELITKQNIDKEYIESLLVKMINSRPDELINELKDYITSGDKTRELKIFSLISEIISNFDIKKQVYIYSIFIYVDETSRYLHIILQLIINSTELELNSKYYLLYQVTHIKFTNQKFSDEKVEILLRNLYNQIYDSFVKKFPYNSEFIKKEDRNKNLIFVFTPQFLGINHAPTRRVLDRMINLKKMGYEVLLINTAEALSIVGYIPFFRAVGPNYVKELNSTNSIDYNGYNIPFYQSENNTPNFNEIISIIEIVKEYKPYMIFSFGNYNIISDIVSKFIPVANMPFATNLPITRATFHIKASKILKEDIKLLKNYGLNENNIIEDRYVFHLKKQTTYLTKKDLNLPENKFIIVFVGNRLDEEITEEYIKRFDSLLKNSNLHLAFVGLFNKFNDYVKKYTYFGINSINLGYQKDIYAVYDCCNLYVNPYRAGGGASSAEALSKGLPIVTLKFGDVYENASDEFSVSSVEEMFTTILKYSIDINFYNDKSKLAVQRSKYITNSQKALKDLIKKIKVNPLF